MCFAFKDISINKMNLIKEPLTRFYCFFHCLLIPSLLKHHPHTWYMSEVHDISLNCWSFLLAIYLIESFIYLSRIARIYQYAKQTSRAGISKIKQHRILVFIFLIFWIKISQCFSILLLSTLTLLEVWRNLDYAHRNNRILVQTKILFQDIALESLQKHVKLLFAQEKKDIFE